MGAFRYIPLSSLYRYHPVQLLRFRLLWQCYAQYAICILRTYAIPVYIFIQAEAACKGFNRIFIPYPLCVFFCIAFQ